MVPSAKILPFDKMLNCNYNNPNTRSVDEAGFSPCFRRNQKRVTFQCTSMAKTSEVDFYNRLRGTFPEVQFVRNVPGLHPTVTHLVVGDGKFIKSQMSFIIEGEFDSFTLLHSRESPHREAPRSFSRRAHLGRFSMLLL